MHRAYTCIATSGLKISNKYMHCAYTYIPTPTPFSSIFLLITVSIFPCVNEYSSMKASKMNATNILRGNERNEAIRKGKTHFYEKIRRQDTNMVYSIHVQSKRRFEFDR